MKRTLLIISIVCLIASTGISQDNLKENTYYIITAKHSGKALDVTMGDKNDGAKVQQYTLNGSDAQIWRANLGSKGWILTAKHSKKVLDVSNGSKDDGAQIQQYTANGTEAQTWHVTSLGDGYYKVISKNSGKALDVSMGSKNDGAKIQQYTWNGSDAQRWKFTQVAYISPNKKAILIPNEPTPKLSIDFESQMGFTLDSKIMAATEYNNKLYFMWRNPLISVPQTYDGEASWEMFGGLDDEMYWQTLDGSIWSDTKQIPDAGSRIGPSVCVSGGSLVIMWRGSGSDPGIYYKWIDKNTGQWVKGQSKIPNVGTETYVTPIVFNNKLYAVWRGIGDNRNLWFSYTTDFQNWAPQAQLDFGHASEYGASLAVYNDRLYAVWRGTGNDEGLFYATMDKNNKWSAQTKIPNVGSQYGARIIVYNGLLYAFWQGGENVGDAIWGAVKDGLKTVNSTISGVAEAIYDMKAAYTRDAKKYDPYADTHVYYSYFNGSSWSAQERLGGAQVAGYPTPFIYKNDLYLYASYGYIGNCSVSRLIVNY